MPPDTAQPVPQDLTLGRSRQRRGQDRAWDTVLMNDEAKEYAASVREGAEDFIAFAKTTKKRRAQVLVRWIEMHEKRWKKFKDDEFCEEELFKRLQDFLSFAVEVSQGRLHKGEKLKMSYNSLRTVTFDILGLAKEFSPALKTDLIRQQVWIKDLQTHAKYLAVLHKLPTDKSPKVYIGMTDLIFLLTTATLQHIFLWTCMMYIAGRPGSFIATVSYPEWFVKWADITIIRTNKPYEFIVQFKVVAWKGGHDFNPWYTCFRLGPTQEKEHMIADPGLTIIAIALRRGDVLADHKDLASLLAGDEVVIRFRPEVLQQPVFVAATAGGHGIDTNAAMTYAAFRAFFQRICELAGFLDVAKKPYIIRRSAASLHNIVLGEILARGIMNHKATSNTLHKYYSSAITQTDVVSSIASNEKTTIMGCSEFDAPRLFRKEIDSRDILPLSLEEALVRSPELRLLHQQRDLLREYIASGAEIPDLDSDELLVVKNSLLPAEIDYLNTFTADGEEQSSLALYGRLQLRCKKELASMRAAYREEQISGLRANTKPLTLEDLDRRLAEAREDRDIIQVIRTLAKNDKGVSRADAEDIFQCDAPGDPADADPADELREARGSLLHELVHFVDPSKRAAVCPLCQDDDRLPQEKREHVFRSLWHRNRHLQVVHSPEEYAPFLPCPPPTPAVGHPEGATLQSNTALLTMRSTVNMLFR
ncbi:hypothetical protein C8T65DRAFT_741463 [Cerioporus squamosus]|nr:hypothetical protein C8T65DRAFT_741463 [Cerioporus squamosus]